MADFKTHLTVSTLAGFGYGTAAFIVYELPLPTCILAAGLCGVSGMLPDIDSHSGKPLRESLAFAAAVVPMMLAHRLMQFGLSHEWIILAGAGLYLTIRFLLAWFLKHYTVHRGMFHSIPAALIFGEIAFLLASGVTTQLRLYTAGAVVIGYLSHLILDEIWSIDFAHGFRLKSSFGTALKFYSHDWWPNLTTFAKLAILTTLAFKEPGWMNEFYQQHMQQPVQQTAARAGEGLQQLQQSAGKASQDWFR